MDKGESAPHSARVPPICAALRLACEEAGVRQLQLAELLGVTQASVSRWWNNVEPELDVLATIESKLNWPRGFLVRAAGYVEEPRSVRETLQADPEIAPGWRRVVLRAYDDAVVGTSRERSGSESRPPAAPKTRRS